MKKITFILSFLLNIIVNPIWSQECSIVTITSPTPTQVSVVSAYDWTEVINTQGDSFTFCLPDGCFYLYTYSDNINWNFNDLTLLFETNNINIQWQYTDSTGYGIAYFEFNTISGCLDPNACNFNPNANCYDYNLCDYSCFGCTDTLASNYSSEATIDNNTCCYNQWVTITVSDSAYFSITNSLGNYILSTDNYYNNLNSGFCFNPGCYNLYVQGIDEDPYSITITDSNNQIIFNQDYQNGSWNSFNFNNNPIFGCIDQTACNYNPTATCNDGNCDYYSCYGCTDTLASNYNPEATIDNGTCCFGPTVNIEVPNSVWWWYYTQYNSISGIGSSEVCISPGCGAFYAYNNIYESFDYTITDSSNVVILSGNSNDQTIEFDDISTVHLPISYGEVIIGCSDPNACNFNINANCFDYNLCDYSCQGCIDSTAYNYNPFATVNNNSCCYDLYYTITTSDPSSTGWWVMDGYGQVIASSDNFSFTQGFCSYTNCLTFNFQNYLGLPTNIEINLNNQTFYNTTITQFTELSFNATETVGCADPNACNYNPQATCLQYNICDYSCLGCTDQDAINFNPIATIDNGSCCMQENWQTIQSNGELYFYVSSNDGLQISQGYYPEITGFCMNTNCYQLYAFSTDYNTQEVIISNDTLGEYFSFTTNPYLGYSIENIGINEIPGCLDPTACNYNPTATCDYGYCEYYCGGCVDTQAINYNENAQYDDGTCSYQVESPMVGIQMITDQQNQQFYVMISLSQMGNTYPYAVTNTLNEEFMTMTEIGTSITGPFNCNDSIQFTFHSLGYNMNTLMTSDIFKMNCSTVSVSEPNTYYIKIYPNPTQDLVTISNVSSNSIIKIKDSIGRIVFNQICNQSNQTISTKEWSNGIYFIEIYNNLESQKFKLQVNH